MQIISPLLGLLPYTRLHLLGNKIASRWVANCASLRLLGTAIAPRWVANCASLHLLDTAIAPRWVTNCASLHLYRSQRFNEVRAMEYGAKILPSLFFRHRAHLAS